jgi:hypothetical protein
MEANYPPADTTFQPILVQFLWQERQADGSLVLRDHQEAVDKTPHRYTINVGGQRRDSRAAARRASAATWSRSSMRRSGR